MLTLVPSMDMGDVLAGVKRERGRHETFRFFQAGVPVYPAWTERRPYLHHGGGAFLRHFGRSRGRGPAVDDGDGDDDNGDGTPPAPIHACGRAGTIPPGQHPVGHESWSFQCNFMFENLL